MRQLTGLIKSREKSDPLQDDMNNIVGKLSLRLSNSVYLLKGKIPARQLSAHPDAPILLWFLIAYAANRNRSVVTSSELRVERLVKLLAPAPERRNILVEKLFSAECFANLKTIKLTKTDFEEIFPDELLTFLFIHELGCDPWRCSELYEQLVGSFQNGSASVSRRKGGAYFTPRTIVDFTCKEVVAQQSKTGINPASPSIKVLDPAMGSGNFLLGVLDCLEDWTQSSPKRSTILARGIFGIDINPTSVRIAFLILAMTCKGDSGISKTLAQNLVCANSLSGSHGLGKMKFDIVIGNPPYVDYRGIDVETKAISKNFESVKQAGRWNLYVPFVELGLNYTKSRGSCALVVPSHWLSAEFGRTLRRILIEKKAIAGIVNISKTEAFKDAATYPIILFCRGSDIHINQIKIDQCEDLEKMPSLTKIETSWACSRSNDSNDFLIPSVASSHEWDWIESLSSHPKLEDFLDNMVWGTSASGYGRKKIDREIFLKLPAGSKKNFAPIIQTADIHEMTIDWQGEYIPKSVFTGRQLDLFNKPKLVIGRLSKSIRAAVDTKGYVVGKSTVATSDDPELLRAIATLLSSDLVNYWFKSQFGSVHMAGGYIRFDIPYLQKIPVPLFDANQIKMLARLYGRSKAEINRAVNELYEVPDTMEKKIAA